jgi:hypothetical protein
MKHVYVRLVVIFIFAILYLVGYVLSNPSNFNFCDIADQKCIDLWTYSIGRPLVRMMLPLILSIVISFLIFNRKIFKIWSYTIIFYITILVLKIISAPIYCGLFLDIGCSKDDIAIIGGKLFVIITSIFVIVSSIKTLITYLKNKKSLRKNEYKNNS